jgi:hypothetical protein
MKKIVLAVLFTLPFSTLAFSETTTTPILDSRVNATTTVDARNQGTSVGSDLSKAVGVAVAPGLTTTLSETCMGSTSFGVGFGGGAVSGGTTHIDQDCVNRLNSREVKSLGDAVVAKEILCNNTNVRNSFKLAGRPCLIDGGTDAASNLQLTISNASKQRQDELYAAAVLRLKKQGSLAN